MMKQLFFTLILVLAISPMLKAQSTTEEKPYIEVYGQAEKEIVPDEIYLTIVLQERVEGRDKVTIEKQEADLKKMMTDLAIPMENLSLSDANADYVDLNWQKNKTVSTKNYYLKLRDAVTLSKVLARLDEMKVSNAYISKVSHSKIKEFEKEVKINAIKNAKEQADYLLMAIGQQTGKPLIVREEQVYDQPVYRLDAVAYKKTASLESDNYEPALPVEFQKIKVQSKIYVKFGIL